MRLADRRRRHPLTGPPLTRHTPRQIVDQILAYGVGAGGRFRSQQFIGEITSICQQQLFQYPLYLIRRLQEFLRENDDVRHGRVNSLEKSSRCA